MSPSGLHGELGDFLRLDDTRIPMDFLWSGALKSVVNNGRNTRRQPLRVRQEKNRQRYRASVVLRRFQVIPSGYE